MANKQGDEMQWQPIETAPKDGTTVLVYCAADDGFNIIEARWHEFHRWKGEPNSCGWDVCPFEADRSTEVFPSHWMPLPQPPSN
jgi:hypothetical protein